MRVLHIWPKERGGEVVHLIGLVTTNGGRVKADGSQLIVRDLDDPEMPDVIQEFISSLPITPDTKVSEKLLQYLQSIGIGSFDSFPVEGSLPDIIPAT